ncbi:hypothetical protein BDB01DRAFT_390378 [Pilobolus umbonatus]|nr:hypothetical protein BDB01DRAFT_390378 [Pilobolus umbonatus]
MQDRNHSLRIIAWLFFGLSKIMNQKTCFLYDDTVLFAARIKNELAIPSRLRLAEVDLSKPLANYSSITLSNQDSLLIYSSSHNALSDMFDFSKKSKEHCEIIDHELCSLLEHSSNAITLPPEQGEASLLPPEYMDHEPIDMDIIEDHCFDMNTHDILLRAEDIQPSSGSQTMSASSSSAGSRDSLHPVLRTNDIPSLIMEEDEPVYESFATDMYSALVSDSDTEDTSPVVKKRRQRYFTSAFAEQGHLDPTTIPYSVYTNEPVCRQYVDKESENDRMDILKKAMMGPSLLLNNPVFHPLFERNQRFFLENTRRIERARTDRRSFSMDPVIHTGGTTVSVQSSSDVTTPDDQAISFGGIAMPRPPSMSTIRDHLSISDYEPDIYDMNFDHLEFGRSRIPFYLIYD